MKKKGILKNVILLLVLLIASILLLIPTLKSINFGLDLQGGFEVLYQVSSLDDSNMTSDKLTSTYRTISRRIDTLGVSEPNIVVEGEDKIRVELAGVTDADEARMMLSKVANLTFRDTNDNLLMNGDVISKATVSTDSNGRPAVLLHVKDKDTFYKATKSVSEMSDNRIVIWLDYDESDSFVAESSNCGSLTNSKCLSVATVGEGFASDVIIQGSFTSDEVDNLASLISSGSLPTKLTEISSKTVNASLGENALNKTFVAGVIGISLIILTMIVLYHVAGFVASVGIIIYTALTFMIFWLIGGVLTLPGIAAVVIGIGMAVDSCVISFARIKEELKKGSKLKNSVINGNKESFMSIFDANITTLIVAVILFIFGESSVKGFATMLIISIFVTMFVMVFVIRWLVTSLVKTGRFDGREYLFIRYKKDRKSLFKNLSFVKFSKYPFIVTLVLVVIGIISLFASGLNLGIDFKGGTAITISSANVLVEDSIKDDMATLGYGVYDYETIDNNTVIVKVTEVLDKDGVLSTQDYLDEKYEASTEIGVVSNIVKKQLVNNAIISLLLASIGIIVYVTFRFQFSYAISGIIALVHDVFIIVALFSLFKLEVSGIFVAAILSIIGYSINDTIVTFDRIRENICKKYKFKLKSEEDLNTLVDTSLKQTLSRSIVTTITTLIPVICLIIFGSHEILNFNIALLFGLIAGTYSSIFIACQIWRILFKGKVGTDLSKNWYDDDEPEEKKIKGINA